jgi:hypothetical protein
VAAEFVPSRVTYLVNHSELETGCNKCTFYYFSFLILGQYGKEILTGRPSNRGLIPDRNKNISFLHRICIGSGAQLAFYSTGTACFYRGKAAGT